MLNLTHTRANKPSIFIEKPQRKETSRKVTTYKLDAESRELRNFTRAQRPTIDPADEVTMKNRSLVSRNLIGQFKVTVV